MTDKRPLGVSILSFAVFLAAAVLLDVGVRALNDTIRALKERPELGGGAIYLAVDMCCLIVAVICGVAGVDLWKLNKRGRPVTIFLMCIFGVLAASAALVSYDESDRTMLWGGGPVCTFCIWAVVYLCLPKIRQKFVAGSAGTPS